MSQAAQWQFVEGQKKHTQDGSQLVALMKGIGLGRRPVLAVDVGCGDGIVAYDILKKEKATAVLAFDILSGCVKAAEKNLAFYRTEKKAEVHRASANAVFREKKNWDRFDRFVINPPFFVSGSGFSNKGRLDQAARHDRSLPLKLWARGARRLLKTGGELYCVFPSERLSELLSVLSLNRVEPKELWWLKDDLRKRRVFLRAVRGSKPGMKIHFDYYFRD